ncbi:MBL fold metallo-hydrolase [Mycobacterium deserti]|uniref:MBL fold metallo-hydrolase n=1 Tax=Mycobacterium deserti TaxID=2978347 RepID=A0ABT2MEP5_9MYCO|nr:MBL fold metallo-hydrolase [Mycobacterium deserti]MCT7660749.1 MBL fold metallo-hydrolase [Mycobacterium deserti]
MSASPKANVVVQLDGLRVERVVTSGRFELDGGSWEVNNNVWLVGDDTDVVVIDAPHDAELILGALGDRDVTAVLCTHGHNDHINAAADLGTAAHAPVLLHDRDSMLWKAIYSDIAYLPMHDGQRIGVAGTELNILHTPGHSPGSVCIYLPEAGLLFSGDTLFQGGPGATGRSYSDFPTIVRSIRERILTLPPETQVFTGHGGATIVGEEAPHLEEWIARGT